MQTNNIKSIEDRTIEIMADNRIAFAKIRDEAAGAFEKSTFSNGRSKSKLERLLADIDLIKNQLTNGTKLTDLATQYDIHVSTIRYFCKSNFNDEFYYEFCTSRKMRWCDEDK